MSRVALRRPRREVAPLQTRWTAEIDEHVSALAWSPDGRMLAAAAICGPVHLFNADDGSAITKLPGHAFGTAALAWAAGPSRLASGGQDAKVRVWNPQHWACEAELDAGAPWVECLGWSRNGAVLAAGAGRGLRFWSGAGALIRECPPHASTVVDIAWHPLRQMLAAACYGGAALWHPDASEPVQRFEFKGSLLALAWSPDGRMLASGNQDDSVHLWFVDTGKDVHMAGYARKVRELAWSADSRLLATGGASDIVVWDCSGKGPEGRRPLQLEQHGEAVSRLAFQRAGGLLASGCAGGIVALWRPRLIKEPLGTAQLGSAVTQLAWSADGRSFAAASEEGAICTFAAPPGK